MQLVIKNMFAKVLFPALFAVSFAAAVPAQTGADVDAVVQKLIDARSGIRATEVVCPTTVHGQRRSGCFRLAIFQ
jgi:hypothetical protein